MGKKQVDRSAPDMCVGEEKVQESRLSSQQEWFANWAPLSFWVGVVALILGNRATSSTKDLLVSTLLLPLPAFPFVRFCYLHLYIQGFRKYMILGYARHLLILTHCVFAGLSIILPILLACLEIFDYPIFPYPYAITVKCIILQLLTAVPLMLQRIPRYDIQALRFFVANSLYCLTFLFSSLMFTAGQYRFYEPFGRAFALVTLYAFIYLVSDAYQHLRDYRAGRFKHPIGKIWFLPDKEKPSLRFAIWDCLYKQPTAEAMEATAAPAIFDTAVSAAITAGFSFTNYYQLFFFTSLNQEGIIKFVSQHPKASKFLACFTLIPIVSSIVGVFLTILIYRDKITERQSQIYAGISSFFPLLYMAYFSLSFPEEFAAMSHLGQEP